MGSGGLHVNIMRYLLRIVAIGCWGMRYGVWWVECGYLGVQPCRLGLPWYLYLPCEIDLAVGPLGQRKFFSEA